MATIDTSKKSQEPPLLPGISYIPDRIDVQEKPDLVNRIEAEFVDFLACVKDLLKLMHTVKPKHMRSLTPMPHTVIREMMETGTKGPLIKKYEKSVGTNIPGISASADSVFKRGMSTVSTTARVKPVLKKPDIYKKKPLEADLVEIIGKKTKPMWHVVAVEKPPDPLINPEDLPPEEKLPCPPIDILNKKNLPLSRTHSDEMIASIRYLTLTTVRPTNPVAQEQMDMLAAADVGFRTVEEYKLYLDTLNPHWFKDLLYDAIKIGIVTSVEVVEAFEQLGHYYNMTSDSLFLARAKLCFLFMSMPIWDVSRMSMQMAVNFILYNILKSPKSHNYLLEWLNARKLPYVAFTPIYADMVELMPSRVTQAGTSIPESVITRTQKQRQSADKGPDSPAT